MRPAEEAISWLPMGPIGSSGIRSISRESLSSLVRACCTLLSEKRTLSEAWYCWSTFIFMWCAWRSRRCGGGSARVTTGIANESRDGSRDWAFRQPPPERTMRQTALHAAVDHHVARPQRTGRRLCALRSASERSRGPERRIACVALRLFKTPRSLEPAWQVNARVRQRRHWQHGPLQARLVRVD